MLAPKERRKNIFCWRHFPILLSILLLLTSFHLDCDAFRLLEHHRHRHHHHRIRIRSVYPHTSDQRIPRTTSLQSVFSLLQSRTFVTSISLLRAWGGDVSSLSSATIRTTSTCRRRVILEMGKGDGKQKRKKKSSTSSAASPASSPAASSAAAAVPAPPARPRVSTNINIPVRQQIRWAQMNKEYAKQATVGFRQKKHERTRYRRTWDEEEIEEKAEERRRKGQDPDWDLILNRTASSPLVIVDGYNIIYKWPRLKKHMVKGDSQRARQLLLDDLENLRSLKGWRIECVFDGTRRSTIGPLGQGPGSSNSPTRMDRESKTAVTKYGVRTVFTGVGIEADTYIEGRCAGAKNVTDGHYTGSFIVATDDAMIRLAGQSAGALCMSADRFVVELKAVKKAVEYRVEAAVAKVNGHSIRPESLRGTGFRFGRRSVLFEDKRNRTKTSRKKQESEYELDLSDIVVEADANGIPWWAKAPNQTKSNGS